MATNAMLTPARMAPGKKKAAAKKPMKDMAFDRNFTKKGTPKLNATSGSGECAMGQRR